MVAGMKRGTTRFVLEENLDRLQPTAFKSESYEEWFG